MLVRERGVVSGGCFVVSWWLKGGLEGGFQLRHPCREKQEREERESVLNAWR